MSYWKNYTALITAEVYDEDNNRTSPARVICYVDNFVQAAEYAEAYFRDEIEKLHIELLDCVPNFSEEIFDYIRSQSI